MDEEVELIEVLRGVGAPGLRGDLRPGATLTTGSKGGSGAEALLHPMAAAARAAIMNIETLILMIGPVLD